MKKSFFKDPTRGNQVIKQREAITAKNNLVDRILELEQDQALVIQREIIPRAYSDSKKFMKHAPEVKPERVYSLREMLAKKLVPVKIRQEAFDRINHPYYSGYSFVPIIGDKTKRKVSLVACLDANRIYCYANQVIPAGIKVEKYSDAQRVEIEGATIPVEVPSRTKEKHRYEFNLGFVALEDSARKYAIASGIKSEGHLCKHKRYMFRYRPKKGKESSAVVNFCPHEIAAYMQVIDTYWDDDKNLRPLEMSQFVIPSQFFVDQYKKICRQVAFEKDGKLKVPNLAQKEILLWAIVQNQGHDKTCFARSIDVRDYNWN